MKYILILAVFFSLPIYAHPVIYKGGWVYWGRFSDSSTTQRVSYTFHPRWSVEINSQSWKALNSAHDDNQTPGYKLHQLGVNVLAKRWFFQESQGNVYFSLSAGFGGNDLFPIEKGKVSSESIWHLYSSRFSFLEKVRSLGVIQPRLEADWESRRLYTALSLKAYYPLAEKEFWPLELSGRMGFAPYTAGMNELQTWLVFQFDYFEKEKKAVKTASLLRFFYKTALWEIGSSFEGDFFLTLMIHY